MVVVVLAEGIVEMVGSDEGEGIVEAGGMEEEEMLSGVRGVESHLREESAELVALEVVLEIVDGIGAAEEAWPGGVVLKPLRGTPCIGPRFHNGGSP